MFAENVCRKWFVLIGVFRFGGCFRNHFSIFQSGVQQKIALFFCFFNTMFKIIIFLRAELDKQRLRVYNFYKD